MHVCTWVDLGVTIVDMPVDAWIRPQLSDSTSVAELLRDFLDASDETFECIFYERKKEALAFVYNLIKKADRGNMHEATFTGITIEPAIDLKCPEEGTSIVDDFRTQTHHDMKWPMLPALHYEQIPSRLCTECVGSYPVPMENTSISNEMHLVPWNREQQIVYRRIVDDLLKPEIFTCERISLADAVRDCLGATDENVEAIFAQQKEMVMALLSEMITYGQGCDYEVKEVHFTGITAEPVSQLKWPDTGKSLAEEVATHCCAPLKWPGLPALHLEHGIMDEDYEYPHEIVPIYPVPMECVYLYHGELKLYGYRKIRIANRPPRHICMSHLFQSLSGIQTFHFCA